MIAIDLLGAFIISVMAIVVGNAIWSQFNKGGK